MSLPYPIDPRVLQGLLTWLAHLGVAAQEPAAKGGRLSGFARRHAQDATDLGQRIYSSMPGSSDDARRRHRFRQGISQLTQQEVQRRRRQDQEFAAQSRQQHERRQREMFERHRQGRQEMDNWARQQRRNRRSR